MAKAKRILFSWREQSASERIVGNIGRFRSGKYMVAIRYEKEDHKSIISNQSETLDI